MLWFTPAGERTTLRKNEVKDYVSELRDFNWQTFEEFNQSKSKYWSINIINDDWILNSSCSCPHFAKHYLCKHVIGIANLLGLEGSAIPENAKDVPLGQKRKRGAPKKANRALLIN